MRCIAVAFLLAGCTVQAPSCRQPHPVTVLQVTRPYTVAAMLNGHPATLLVDTGSTENILTTAAAARLSLRTEHLLDDLDVPSGYAFQGTGGRRHYDRVETSRFTLPGVTRLGLQFAVLWSGYDSWRMDGLLGMSLLQEFDLDLGDAQGPVTLYEPGTLCGDGFIAVPTLHRFSATVAAVLDGRPVVALLDTGAEETVLFAPIGWAATGPAHGANAAGGIGPGLMAVRPYVAARLDVGGLELRDVAVTAVNQARPAQADLILGLDFFRRVHVMLSPAKSTAWMRKV